MGYGPGLVRVILSVTGPGAIYTPTDITMKTVRFEYPSSAIHDVIVTMDFDQAAVHAIRALPKWARSWDAASGTWRVHPAHADRLAAALRRIGFQIVGVDLERPA